VSAVEGSEFDADGCRNLCGVGAGPVEGVVVLGWKSKPGNAPQAKLTTSKKAAPSPSTAN
jgi:hypothetical protein